MLKTCTLTKVGAAYALGYIQVFDLFLIFPTSLKKKLGRRHRKKSKNHRHVTRSPPPPSPDALPTTVTNNAVALSRFAPPPSPSSPASPERSGANNLFRDGAEKRFSDLPSTEFSPPKKKGGRPPRRGAGISPRDIDVLDADESDDNVEDGDYSPNPANKDPRPTMQPKRRDKKVILDSSYFFYLWPLTFDAEQFRRGHLQVYSMDNISRFDANYQKQLSFNFSATRATRKKPVAMIDAQAWASRLWDVDLDVAPTSFSCDTTDHHDQS